MMVAGIVPQEHEVTITTRGERQNQCEGKLHVLDRLADGRSTVDTSRYVDPAGTSRGTCGSSFLTASTTSMVLVTVDRRSKYDAAWSLTSGDLVVLHAVYDSQSSLKRIGAVAVVTIMAGRAAS